MANGGYWEIRAMKAKEDKEKTYKNIASYSLPLNHHNVAIFQDMHYCLLLSPFFALEWIYVDS